MKSNLSHILPVWKACRILGEERVKRIVATAINLRSRNTTSYGYQQPQAMPRKDEQIENDEEVEQLVKALFYIPSQNNSAGSNNITARSAHSTYSVSGNSRTPMPQQARTPTPPIIAQAWKKMSTKRQFGMDKTTLFKYLIPGICQPHSGPNGHMGLFDCFIYALQGHAPSSSATYYGGASSTLIWIPDILIFLAICFDYHSMADSVKAKRKEVSGQSSTDSTDMQDKDDTTPENQYQSKAHQRDVISTMALMSFRIYDSYQKKGTITRDTVHRFFTDVYGENSFKTPTIQMLLDNVFCPTVADQVVLNSHGAGTGQAAISEAHFAKRILETTSSLQLAGEVETAPSDPADPSDPAQLDSVRCHALLDWIAELGMAMVPLSEIPISTQAYLDAIETTHRPICSVYNLDESKLYEVKRRFHSLVESSAVIQGDPMAECGDDTESDAPSNSKTPQSPTAPTRPLTTPKHVISQTAFIKAVTRPNDDMGHGGYLPTTLAQLVFETICPTSDDGQTFLGLYNVLKFGCEAVRIESTKLKRNEDVSITPADQSIPLLRLVFQLFGKEQEGTDTDGRTGVLNRRQVANMILLLVEHHNFRGKEDSLEREEHNTESGPNNQLLDMATETIKVPLGPASSLGIVPPKLESRNNNKEDIALDFLVDYVFEQAKAESQTCLSFEEFCNWNSSGRQPTQLSLQQQRLGPLLLELRLVASVLFGIPPTMASMEVALVAEIQKRHKQRYPPTEFSRRGPRGTVWYIIDDRWFKAWAAHVKRVSGTPADVDDGRGVVTPGSTSDVSRGMGKINNRELLVENGSLALRADIRWGHDYEILPPLAWSALQAWYDGGPPIHRTVVPYIPSSSNNPHSRVPRIRTENEMELYPFFVTVFLCDVISRGEARPFQQYVPVSRVSPVRVVLLRLAKGLDVDPRLCRLWFMGGNPNTPVEGSTSSFTFTVPTAVQEEAYAQNGENDWLLDLDMNIVDQKTRWANADMPISSINLLLELKDKETGLWPRGLDGKSWSFQDKNNGENAAIQTGDGVVGLFNMGNTCYLNSSVQCLSHTPIFREYFTSKAYLNDINTTNPLGHEGRLAQVSAVLINSLWKRYNNSAPHQPRRMTVPGSYAPVSAPSLTPKTFKESLGKFNDHFAGNEQHDAQELLAFLLGGLSEDLNRIVDKPYIEAPDSDGRPDSELADIWWSNHLKREMSIIVALFTGQYKSLLTCRSCKYESARFEPFSFLQVPLPEDDHISATLILYPLKQGTDVMKYCVRVRHDGTLFDVLVALAKVLHADEIASDIDGSTRTTTEEKKNSDSESRDEEEAELYRQRARNLAVVDLRDGYISKVASNSWTIPDIQIKESGELPLLHVYELDPLPLGRTVADPGELGKDEDHVPTETRRTTSEDDSEYSETDEMDDEEGDVKEEDNDGKAATSFLAVAQRKTELVSRDVLHPLNHQVFGTPILLRVVDLEKYTGHDLYDLVAKRLVNFVPKSAHRFLTGEDNEVVDSDDKKPDLQDKSESRFRWKSTTKTDMECVAAGSVPRYGFRLRISSRDGRRCTLCPWFECCVGCLIPDDNCPTVAAGGDSIVVDWHFAVDIATSGFGQRLNQAEAIMSTPSMRGAAGTVRRAPGLNIKNHYSCGVGAKGKGFKGAITLEACLDAFAKEEKIPEAYCSRCKEFRIQTKKMSLWRLPPVVIIHLKRFQFTQHMRRKLRDLVVFPIEGLDMSRIVTSDPSEQSSAETDVSEKAKQSSQEDGASRMANDDGRSEMLYDLYGVVHHQGALSGGHYVASLKSELDGQWRLFNDAQIFEIHSRDVVDASAYILFYIRRDVKDAKLSDYWDTTTREGEGLTEEDMEKLIRGRSDQCVIS